MRSSSWDDDIPNWMETSKPCFKPPTRYLINHYEPLLTIINHYWPRLSQTTNQLLIAKDPSTVHPSLTQTSIEISDDLPRARLQGWWLWNVRFLIPATTIRLWYVKISIDRLTVIVLEVWLLCFLCLLVTHPHLTCETIPTRDVH